MIKSIKAFFKKHKRIEAIGAVIAALVISVVLQVNAAAARPQAKAHLSIVRDSGYYELNKTLTARKALDKMATTILSVGD